MEEKLNPVAEHPVPTTDQAPNESSSSAPEAATEQGVSAATAEGTSMNSDTPNSPSPANGADNNADSSDTSANSDTNANSDTSANMSTDSQADSPAENAQADTDNTDMSAAGTADASAVDTSAVDTSADDSAMEGMTMEDVMAASDDQLTRRPIHRGMILTGSVIMLAQDGIIVDVSAKIEGLVPYNQLFEFEVNAEEAAKYFKPGDEIQVYVVRADIPNSTIILSKRRADQERAWNLLSDIYEKKLPVEVEVVEKVRGGLVANLGVRAFLPASQVDVRRVNDLTPYVGKRLKVRIIELNRKRNRVIISRRSIIEEELSEQKEDTLKKLEPGARLEGEVVEITDFGVFVNLGGIDGLVHRSEISHGRFNHPKEVLELGQKVKVEVLDMDLERERINLSMKSLISDPWENVLSNYVIGEKVSGVVTNLTPFGAFVEIEPGLEGLIHVSEMSWTKRIRHPKEIVTESDEVEAMILKIDVSQKRISLGLRQTQPDPWSSLPDRFPPGTEVSGPITGITDFGVFMEIEEGIEGLIHISELAHEHIDNISEHFKRGDEVEAVILNIDPVEQRASLSRKRLLPYTAEMDMAADAPAAGGGRSGGRKGRRGGRRSAGIDYDYSYAASDSGGKATAKLGDVYADLFAQFGLTDGADDGADEEGQDSSDASAEATTESAEATAGTSAEATPETSAEATATTDVSTEATSSDAEASAEATQETAPEMETVPEASAESAEAASGTPETSANAGQAEASSPEASSEEGEGQSTENMIDAAEAAALLTAAFRDGRRPANEVNEANETNEEASDGEEENKN